MNDKLSIMPSDCDCKRCRMMCHAPCCPTPQEADALIDAGYAGRLMLDDLPGGPTMLKPALKSYERKRAPWGTSSLEGCTFWKKDGKCELHSLALKPRHAQLAHHSLSAEQWEEVCDLTSATWEDEELVKTLIQKWKTAVESK